MNPFSVLTSKIFGGLVVVLLIAAGVQTWRLNSCQNTLEQTRKDYALEQAKHSITRQSVHQLEVALAGQNKAIKELAASADAKQKATQEALAKASERERASEGVIARLKASAQTGASQCPVSDTLAKVEGL